MISFGWLLRLLRIADKGKIVIRDPVTGEDAIVISERLFRDTISDAYEAGANDAYNENANVIKRDKYINDICEDLAL